MKSKLKIVVFATMLAMALTIIFCFTLDIKVIKASAETKVHMGITPESLKDKYSNTPINFNENDNMIYNTYKSLNIGLIFKPDYESYIRSNFILEEDKLSPVYNTDLLLSTLEELNNNRIEHVYSKLEKTDSEFIVSEQVIGNKLDVIKLKDYIVGELDGTAKEIDLTMYYIDRDSTQPTYEELIAEVEKVNNTYITYTNGCKVALVDFIDYCLIVDNKIVLDETALEELKYTVDKLIEKQLIDYDTVGNPLMFKTTGGETIEITEGTWGNIFDSNAETEYIIESFKNFNTEENRTPVMKYSYGNEIPDTYVEVSLDEQHVWWYKDGELVMDSGCVTGHKGKMDTPTGVYFIFQKANNVTFPVGGSSKNWMKFTTRGHGLHDATWRSLSQFGTDRYTWNGSHGCVNLPLEFANKLYDEVELGTCVVIY